MRRGRTKTWTSHDVADLAEHLARVLREMPDSPLSALLRPSTSQTSKAQTRHLPADTHIRKRLADFKKPDLVRLIDRYNLPLKVGRKDSAAKLVARLVAYLRENPASNQRLSEMLSKGSPELANALRTLRNFGAHGHPKR
jgi:hypothetical protein